MGGLRLRAQRPPHGRLPQKKLLEAKNGSYLFRDTEAQRKSSLQMESVEMASGACGAPGSPPHVEKPRSRRPGGAFPDQISEEGR